MQSRHLRGARKKKTESVENTKSSENASTTGRKNPSGNIIPADSRIPSKYGSSVDSGNASKYAASTGSADTSTNAERDRQAPGGIEASDAGAGLSTSREEKNKRGTGFSAG